ncbi:MAG: ABC transporter permease [Gemmatimonadetes bacterium]|uniref:ABC transporter permease n=1 Tax=Candidatus Kutchimonas denitrificans TaxID=3056748 RepID=A0AAE5CB67_9BACT|nr:ABC transporter permease [Gemmatimonadota bacterium]NIR74085.1 ABC transporter permease [Candidatus Kutchimonas denitrificans]NIS01647.1 ABC transporter permease [Gemmatimonadota bacterium]NIT67385.1 ABC transporter permease [Gemmatimonadota bacterium]NIU52748.1 FtsX-like permease family protein [Gemmatimonadota bacterium]
MRLPRLILLLYPRRFRARVGDELLQTLRDVHDGDVSRRGRVRACGRLALDLADLIIGGLIERARGLRARRGNPVSSSGPPPKKETEMSTILQDVRYSLRWIRKQPGFTAIVVLTVALGVGVNTSMFSVVYGVLLEPLPYEEPEELVLVFQTDRFNDTRREGVSGPDYFDYVERQSVFEWLAAFAGAPNPTLTPADGEAERLNAVQVTHTLFPTLGWSAALGRTFVPEEDVPDGPAVTVLSHGLWTRRFGADSTIVGRTIRLDGNAYTVVGVMPPDFRFGGDADLWLPLGYTPVTSDRGVHNLLVIGRMRDDVSLATAQAEMDAIMAALEETYPDDNVGRGANLVRMETVVTGDVRPALLLLMGAVALVLVISCANVANLLLTRSITRHREVAVRAALGASRRRLIGQFLSESLLLALAGGALGLLFAVAGIELLRDLAPAALPQIKTYSLNAPVLLFALGATLATGITFGVLPAIRTSRPNLNEELAEGGRGSTEGRTGRLRDAIAVAQVALAFVLAVGAGLTLRSMWNIAHVDPGFNHENLVRLSVSLPQVRYPNSFGDWPNVPEVQRFHAEVVERAERLPFVRSAALALNNPTVPGWTTRVRVEGGPETVEEGVEEERIRPVSAGYFATTGVRLLRGRDFDDRDDGSAPLVGIVNQSFARKYFPDEGALGERFHFWGAWREIVGVVADVKFMGLDQETRPAFYVPLTQVPFSQFDILVRAEPGSTEKVVQAMRTEIRQLDPELAVFNAGSVEQLVSRLMAPQRFNLIMLGLFAALALTLAAVGIYGVIAYGVGRRIREFGVRMSLGADRSRIVQLVLSQGMKLAGVGILLGLVAALAASRLISGLLFDVAAVDPATLAGVAVFLALVALAAAVVPALRAGRVNPVVALREE